MPYWRIETLERDAEEQELGPVVRYAETDDPLAWLRSKQTEEAPRIIVYRGHSAITEQEYNEGVS